ncbi:uncharacterized protein LOC111074682 [Drosophila obscura]|uniref:uncharacterized protein LOC111074682 n=1 Tax=Drosophila obscura TaxID=7282 RepID=UPI001BB16D02|nr:uncharacterized protein LOC111074682 [Drosophila obscura]
MEQVESFLADKTVEACSQHNHVPNKSKPTENADKSDSDVEIVECFGLDEPNSQKIGENTLFPPAKRNVTQIPLPLATPPWSPTDTAMPILTNLLSGNGPIQIPPGMVLCIPCYLCQKQFYDVDLLKEHLNQHVMEMYQNSSQPQVTGQPTMPQPFLKPIKIHFSSEQSKLPRDPSFNNTYLQHIKKNKDSAECSICKIVLSSRQCLDLHHRRFHKEKPRKREKRFACMYCNLQYVHKGHLNRHIKKVHNFHGFDLPKEPACRIPSPCSSSASTSESNSTETSTELFIAEPAVDYNPTSGEFIAPWELGNGEPTAEYCPPILPSVEASPQTIKAEPGVNSCAASESTEELAAKAAAHYCPPAQWAAMGLPFANGYFIPMDPNKIYPPRRDDCFFPEFSNWISEEDMEKYAGRGQT